MSRLHHESEGRSRPPLTLGEHFRRSIRAAHQRRPASFYLLFAILAVVFLGSQIVFVREDPKRFALFLSLNFTFFFVVIFRALIDSFEIMRNHFRERHAVFGETIGEPEFAQRLGRSVHRGRNA